MGDTDVSVAKFVATVVFKLDTAVLESNKTNNKENNEVLSERVAKPVKCTSLLKTCSFVKIHSIYHFF